MAEAHPKPRLYALDGIRGIAIILVVLQHLPVSAFKNFLPLLVTRAVFGSGITGVSLLFILSGFFMAYIYPHPTSVVGFWQKRYTRIFPLFLTLSAIVTLVHVFPWLPWQVILGVLVGLAVLVHLVWVRGVRRLSASPKKILFGLFLCLQVAVGLWYVYLLRQPPVVLNQQLPVTVREATIGLVNATLTLPLGNYIPMLDGVYWSLIAEIAFYLLYPVICVPIIEALLSKSRRTKLIVLVFTMPFFGGLTLLSTHLASFAMVNLYLCWYFVPGMTLGILYRRHPQWFASLKKSILNAQPLVWLLLFLLVVLAKGVSFGTWPKSWDIWMHMLWGIPLTVLIGTALLSQSALRQALENRLLVWFGTISYSLYLVHATIIGLGFPPLTTLLLIIEVSYVTYLLLEKPYFTRDKSAVIGARKPSEFRLGFAHPRLTVGIVGGLFLLALFAGYQSQFNFFSKVVNLAPPSTAVSLAEVPLVRLQFTAPADNLQILALHIQRQTAPTGMQERQRLIFRIKESGAKDWYATDTYDLGQIGDSPTHLFGFPLLAAAKGKTYEIELSLGDPPSANYLVVYPGTLRGVFAVNKKALLTHPSELVAFISDRVKSVASNPEAQAVVVLTLPLFGLIAGTL